MKTDQTRVLAPLLDVSLMIQMRMTATRTAAPSRMELRFGMTVFCQNSKSEVPIVSPPGAKEYHGRTNV
ncbi:hypothetical protein SMC7_00275 [Candidatus Cryosericum terrychapinii]|uniref:Uncharacterized protein n=1 Tax=Candidatus Cryosericum terrychapinii TaxID=2290919 RepID=A0A398CU92_9BACT|nr:hypothetical protein SMC7_00275 [Candidatus Cryosericum terrychapinii]